MHDLDPEVKSILDSWSQLAPKKKNVPALRKRKPMPLPRTTTPITDAHRALIGKRVTAQLVIQGHTYLMHGILEEVRSGHLTGRVTYEMRKEGKPGAKMALFPVYPCDVIGVDAVNEDALLAAIH